jgi:uncharacterized membrane protein YcfT
MSTHDILIAIQNSAVAHAVSKSNHLVGAGLQIVHVLGFILLLAALVLISLRVLGLALKNQSIPDVAVDATRLIWIGLALAVVSGTLMFVATPTLYFYKWAFELKMGLLVIAVILQTTVFRKVSRSESPNPAFARTSVLLSLLAWFGIGFAGRIIGFI